MKQEDGMGKQLIIVESPAKVKTIRKFLGPDYMVEASVGHVRDLPGNTLGVDENNNFQPQYEVIDKKKNIVNALRQAALKADVVYLAPDPDREGEAIAWHVAELIKKQARAIRRIQFNEITEHAVREAIAHPRELDENLFEAQQARRILDRLVGYKISPLLWKTVKRGISAGRVQSVALKLIVEREIERENFRPEEYWPFHAWLNSGREPLIKAELVKINGRKAKLQNAREADEFERHIASLPFIVEDVDKKERSRNPQPPFITSTLQQMANQRHGYTAKRTMQIAQKLYEGVEFGKRGLTALITYMRTDSVRIAEEARQAARKFIAGTLGQKYLPSVSRQYRTKSSAQDAHEAIRPVDVGITPEIAKEYLSPEQFNIYKMIWQRFIASQMAAARVLDTKIRVACGSSQWLAKGEQIIFDGFLKVMPGTAQDADGFLPEVERGQTLDLVRLEKEQKFTQPAPRFTEAALVKELEDLGIGRPSTYAAIISTLQDREYVIVEDRKLAPTDLGRIVCKQLVDHFSRLMDVGFTAQMEANLDKVAEGNENWTELLQDFASDFNPTLEAASKNMQSMKKGLPVELECPLCQRPLAIKFGKAGAFLACTGYPECEYTSNFARNSDGTVQAVAKDKPQYEVVGKCPECGNDLVIKKSRAGGKFIACSGYPACHYATSLSTGVICPVCGIGEMVEKSTRRGKPFYSCSRYPQCDFALWLKPVPETCPECGQPYLLEKLSGNGKKLVCPKKECGFVKESKDG